MAAQVIPFLGHLNEEDLNRRRNKFRYLGLFLLSIGISIAFYANPWPLTTVESAVMGFVVFFVGLMLLMFSFDLLSSVLPCINPNSNKREIENHCQFDMAAQVITFLAHLNQEDLNRLLNKFRYLGLFLLSIGVSIAFYANPWPLTTVESAVMGFVFFFLGLMLLLFSFGDN